MYLQRTLACYLYCILQQGLPPRFSCPVHTLVSELGILCCSCVLSAQPQMPADGLNLLLRVPNSTNHTRALLFACFILCSVAGCWGLDEATLKCWATKKQWHGFQSCQQLSPTMLMYWKVGWVMGVFHQARPQLREGGLDARCGISPGTDVLFLPNTPSMPNQCTRCAA